MSVMRVIVFDPCTKFVVRRTSRSGIFGRGVKRASDLDLWPFDLLMGLRIPRVMGFHPANLPLAMPFCSGLSAGTGQTDDGHRCIMPHSYGSGWHNKSLQALCRLGSHQV